MTLTGQFQGVETLLTDSHAEKLVPFGLGNMFYLDKRTSNSVLSNFGALIKLLELLAHNFEIE